MSVFRFIMFFFYFVAEVIKSNLRVALAVLSIKQRFSPTLCALKVSKLSAPQRVLLAALISMTPGTISVWTDNEHKTIEVHCFYSDGPAGLVNSFVPRFYQAFGKEYKEEF